MAGHGIGEQSQQHRNCPDSGEGEGNIGKPLRARGQKSDHKIEIDFYIEGPRRRREANRRSLQTNNQKLARPFVRVDRETEHRFDHERLVRHRQTDDDAEQDRDQILRVDPQKPIREEIPWTVAVAGHADPGGQESADGEESYDRDPTRLRGYAAPEMTALPPRRPGKTAGRQGFRFALPRGPSALYPLPLAHRFDEALSRMARFRVASGTIAAPRPERKKGT